VTAILGVPIMVLGVPIMATVGVKGFMSSVSITIRQIVV